MPNIEHEREICDLITGLHLSRQEETISKRWYPEDEKPPLPNPIDAVYLTTHRNYVVEHTTIEGYPNQITEDHKVSQLLEVKHKLTARISGIGSYHIRFDTEALKNQKINAELINMLANWVIEKAPTLEIGSPRTAPRHMVRETLQLKGRSIEVTLSRWPDEVVRVLVERSSPEDQEDRLLSTMRAALNNKLKKLAKWKDDRNAYSILILESIDIALLNGSSIASSLFTAIEKFVQKPDVIYIVQTNRAECHIWQCNQPFSFENFLSIGDYTLNNPV